MIGFFVVLDIYSEILNAWPLVKNKMFQLLMVLWHRFQTNNIKKVFGLTKEKGTIVASLFFYQELELE
jgi:hypothetical protein